MKEFLNFTMHTNTMGKIVVNCNILFAYLTRHHVHKHTHSNTCDDNNSERLFVLLFSLYTWTMYAIIVQMNHKYSMVAFWHWELCGCCFRVCWLDIIKVLQSCPSICTAKIACVIPNDQSLRLMYKRIMC